MNQAKPGFQVALWSNLQNHRLQNAAFLFIDKGHESLSLKNGPMVFEARDSIAFWIEFFADTAAVWFWRATGLQLYPRRECNAQ
jgi:hypothetical protein